MTPKQHRALVSVSDGDWWSMSPEHSATTIATLYRMGCIRCDDDALTYPERIWTITPMGLAVLEAEQ